VYVNTSVYRILLHVAVPHSYVDFFDGDYAIIVFRPSLLQGRLQCIQRYVCLGPAMVQDSFLGKEKKPNEYSSLFSRLLKDS
jgi:hypothetical protein